MQIGYLVSIPSPLWVNTSSESGSTMLLFTVAIVMMQECVYLYRRFVLIVQRITNTEKNNILYSKKWNTDHFDKGFL